MQLEDIKIQGVKVNYFMVPEGAIPAHVYEGRVHHAPEFYLKSRSDSMQEGYDDCLRQLESIVRHSVTMSNRNHDGIEESIIVIIGCREGKLNCSQLENNQWFVEGSFSVSVHRKIVSYTNHIVRTPYTVISSQGQEEIVFAKSFKS